MAAAAVSRFDVWRHEERGDERAWDETTADHACPRTARHDGIELRRRRDRGSDRRLNENVQCPEGFVGWNFGSRPIPTNTQFFQAAQGDAGVADFTPDVNITIESLTCAPLDRFATRGERISYNPAAAESFLKVSCENRRACTLPSNDACRVGTVMYRCGDVDEAPRTASADHRTSWSLSCPTVEQAIAADRAKREQRTPQTACVPALCHGKTRRDTNLNCAPDTSVAEVVEPKFTSFTIVDRYPPYSAAQDKLCDSVSRGTGGCLADDLGFLGRRSFFEDQAYRVSATMEYPNGAPANARMTVWFADQFVPRAVEDGNFVARDEWDSKDSIYAFRCTATKLDMSRRFAVQGSTTGEVRFEQDVIWSKECVDRDPAEITADAARRAGLSNDDFSKKYQLRGTRAFLAYDIEGETVFARGQEVNTTCQPNPPAFFYDEVSQTYDMVAYYNQRRVEPFITKDSFTSNATGDKVFYKPEVFAFGTASKPHQGHVGPVSMEIGKSELTVRRGAPSRPSLPVSLSWYAANFSRCHPYSPRKENRCPDNFAGNPKPGAWFGELGADVYVWPVGKMHETTQSFPRIGRIRFSDGDAGETNESADLVFTPELVDTFFNASSPMYIPPSNPPVPRAYNVFYCLSGRSRDGHTFDPKFFGPAPSTYAMSATVGIARNPWTITVDDTDARLSAFFPDRHPSTGAEQPAPRGCRFAKTPLLITADRLIRAVEPVSDTEWTSSPSTTSAGDANMAGSTVNDSTQTNSSGGACGPSDTCTVMSANSGNSSGNFGQSFFDSDSMIRYQRGGRVKADMQAEALQFPMLDLGDSEMEVDFPVTRAPVTLSVAPDFEPVAQALQRAAAGTPVKWIAKRVQTTNGIGVGWANKVPMNIGPVPGEVVITATVAIGVEGTFQLEGIPSDNDAYPCLGPDNASASNKCIGIAVENGAEKTASYDDAAQHCAVLGGRLAELGDANEASQLMATIASSSSDRFWTGGQASYLHRSDQCGRIFDPKTCVEGSSVSYRWVSNDAEIASAAKLNVVSGDVNGANLNNLTSPIPKRAALTLDKRNNLDLAFVNDETQYPFVCVFDHADSEEFLKTTVSVKVAARRGDWPWPTACPSKTQVCVSPARSTLLPQRSRLQFRTRRTSWCVTATCLASATTPTSPFPGKSGLMSGDITASVNVLFVLSQVGDRQL